MVYTSYLERLFGRQHCAHLCENAHQMIRWYDYPIAFLAADVMANAFFSIPIVGAFIAWGIYEMWNHIYIPWRYNQEYGE
jgi:hypothetical protein